MNPSFDGTLYPDISHEAKGEVYQYKLSLISILLNPPELLVYRVVCGVSWLLLIWCLTHSPESILLWVAFFALTAFSWKMLLHSGLPPRFHGKAMNLCITERAVTIEMSGNLYSVPRNYIKVRKGWLRTNILSTLIGHCFLVNESVIPFEVLKSKVESPNTAAPTPTPTQQ
jgi:hypothetical protein